MMGRFMPPPPEGAGSPFDWGRREYATQMLGSAFELEFFDGVSPQEGESAEQLWELFSMAMGPLQMLLQSDDEQRLREIHDAFIDFYAEYTLPDGTISQPREYVVIVGQKR